MPSKEEALPGEAGHAQQVPVTEADMINVQTMDQFAGMFMAWHQNKIKVLKHMQAIPEGTEIEITFGDVVREIKLEGEAMAAYHAGIELALIEFQNLPFAVSVEDAPNDPVASS